MSMMQQLAFAFSAVPAYARDDFFVSGANREAYDWVHAWPNWPGHSLLLTGPAGSGKSHLAALWRTQARAEAIAPERIGHAPSELLMPGLAAHVDGIESADEAGLFHLLNYAAGAHKYLLLTARSTAAFTTPDLVSRLSALPRAQLLAPDDTLMSAVLAKQFADRQLSLSPAVLTFLAARMERSFAGAQRLAAALDEAAFARGRAITLPLAREVLERLHKSDEAHARHS